mmetsp:Transcript_116647/g.371072  ORF Transcript_116647/g.371072 Transcript_116647/m.371072 type:complete len:271 (-) Transcript_116647:458-1270(-)
MREDGAHKLGCTPRVPQVVVIAEHDPHGVILLVTLLEIPSLPQPSLRPHEGGAQVLKLRMPRPLFHEDELWAKGRPVRRRGPKLIPRAMATSLLPGTSLLICRRPLVIKISSDISSAKFRRAVCLLIKQHARSSCSSSSPPPTQATDAVERCGPPIRLGRCLARSNSSNCKLLNDSWAAAAAAATAAAAASPAVDRRCRAPQLLQGPLDLGLEARRGGEPAQGDHQRTAARQGRLLLGDGAQGVPQPLEPLLRGHMHGHEREYADLRPGL